jgi:hypothetical protein
MTFATRTFDALAALVEREPGELHRLMNREPVDSEPRSTLENLEHLNLKLSSWPYLKYVHSSRILPNLSLCSVHTLPYLIDWLPSPLKEASVKYLSIAVKKLPQDPLAQRFIVSTWSSFLQSILSCPLAFKPRTNQEELLKLSQDDLAIRAQYMAIYAIEPYLKNFIEKEAREKLKKALNHLPYGHSIDFIRYIQQSRRQLDTQLPYSFPLNLWDGTAQSLGELVHKFSMACLARLISAEEIDFHNELSLHVSESFWQQLPKINTIQKPEVMSHLQGSFSLASSFLEKTRI